MKCDRDIAGGKIKPAQTVADRDDQLKRSEKLACYTTTEFGIPITVTDTAVVDPTGAIFIPHGDKLMAAAAVFRCTLPQRLNGKEMKFLRKAMDMSSSKWADYISTDRSTLSRWESNKQPMSASAEKLLRLTALAVLWKDAPGIEVDSKLVPEMEFQGFACPDSFPDMRFVLTKFRKEELYSDMQEAA